MVGSLQVMAWVFRTPFFSPLQKLVMIRCADGGWFTVIELAKFCCCSIDEAFDTALDLHEDAFLEYQDKPARFAIAELYLNMLDQTRPVVKKPMVDERARIVYFVRSGSRVKIGITAHLQSRLKALRTASADQLEVIATRPGFLADEQALHERFAKHRLSGEWFTWCDEIATYVATLTVAA